MRSSLTFYRIVVEQKKHREGGWHFHAAIHCLPMDFLSAQERLRDAFQPRVLGCVCTSTMYVNGESHSFL